MKSGQPSRRDFVTAASALVVGLQLPKQSYAWTERNPAEFRPVSFIRIGADDVITVHVSRSEMGQGIFTSWPMIVAEELDAAWETIRVEPTESGRSSMRKQLTNGSKSIRMFVDSLRSAGAAAREMLLSAAASDWAVDVGSCRTELGEVVHAETGRRVRYGALVQSASRLPVPPSPKLKDPKDFKIIGTRTHRLDTPQKVDGSARFGIDVRVPGMLVATVLRPPTIGASVKSFDPKMALTVEGVKHVVQTTSGVAVVADSFWTAKKGRAALEVVWEDTANNAELTSDRIADEWRKAATTPGVVCRSDGNPQAALEGAAKRISAEYRAPYQSHATMEPMNAIAHVRPDSVDVWAPTQAQTMTRDLAVEIAGVDFSRVDVHTPYLGGGFGGKEEMACTRDALEISKAVGAPVKVVWTREDDIQHDFFRPAALSVLSGGLGPDGNPTALTWHLVTPSIWTRRGRPREIDNQSVEGAADLDYAVKNLLVEFHMRDPGLRIGTWRSVGFSHNAFVRECFLDELAVAGGKDPVALRRSLLGEKPRLLGVLDRVAKESSWGARLPKRHGRGVALQFSFGSYVAQVAEVSVVAGKIRVHRVVVAIDCGMIINPDTIEAQMQGSVAFALSAALKTEITVAGGQVVQSNFDDYPVLRINEMPKVEVHIIKSSEASGGVGEPGVPPLAPAVGNAIFAATGTRLRSMPFRLG